MLLNFDHQLEVELSLLGYCQAIELGAACRLCGQQGWTPLRCRLKHRVDTAGHVAGHEGFQVGGNVANLLLHGTLGQLAGRCGVVEG